MYIYIYIYIDGHQQEVDTFDSVLLLLLFGRLHFLFFLNIIIVWFKILDERKKFVVNNSSSNLTLKIVLVANLDYYFLHPFFFPLHPPVVCRDIPPLLMKRENVCCASFILLSVSSNICSVSVHLLVLFPPPFTVLDRCTSLSALISLEKLLIVSKKSGVFFSSEICYM